MFESEVITFVAPKKSGWLKKKGTGEHDHRLLQEQLMKNTHTHTCSIVVTANAFCFCG